MRISLTSTRPRPSAGLWPRSGPPCRRPGVASRNTPEPQMPSALVAHRVASGSDFLNYVKRCDHGFRNFEHYRLLLHYGGSKWQPQPPQESKGALPGWPRRVPLRRGQIRLTNPKKGPTDLLPRRRLSASCDDGSVERWKIQSSFGTTEQRDGETLDYGPGLKYRCEPMRTEGRCADLNSCAVVMNSREDVRQ